MPTARKKYTPPDWQFTMEQIGRELRKVDPSADMPPRLRALFTELERKWAIAMRRNQEPGKNDGERN